jgi:hypothetical protein
MAVVRSTGGAGRAFWGLTPGRFTRSSLQSRGSHTRDTFQLLSTPHLSRSVDIRPHTLDRYPGRCQPVFRSCLGIDDITTVRTVNPVSCATVGFVLDEDMPLIDLLATHRFCYPKWGEQVPLGVTGRARISCRGVIVTRT